MTIAWTASAHHAAVNFGQYDYTSFPLNAPSLIRKAMPRSKDDADWKVRSPACGTHTQLVGCAGAIVGAGASNSAVPVVTAADWPGDKMAIQQKMMLGFLLCAGGLGQASARALSTLCFWACFPCC